MNKRMISLLLTAVLLLTLFPAAFAEPFDGEIVIIEEPEEEPIHIIETTGEAEAEIPDRESAPQAEDDRRCGDHLSWELDKNGTLSISGTGSMWNYSWDSHPGWYPSRFDISSVVIKNGVTSIGEFAFVWCSDMHSITIPASVTKIGQRAFQSCMSLAEITIPGSVTSIGDDAFHSCYALKSLTVPNSVTSIGAEAFFDCSGLTDIFIGKGVTSIGADAFTYCNKLQTIRVDGGNSSYRSLDGVLFSADGKTLVRFPEGRSGAYAVLEGVTSLGNKAFYNCTELTELSLPASLAAIPAEAFAQCYILSAFRVDPDSRYFQSLDGVLYTRDGRTLLSVPESRSGAYTVPEGVTRLENGAFMHCAELTSVSLPEGLTAIGGDAFYACSSLTNVNLPQSVTSLGAYAFALCSSLKSISLPDGLTGIGEYTFWNCDSLTRMTIPQKVASIGARAFINCSKIKTIEFLGAAPKFGESCFMEMNATARYPTNRSGWTEKVRQNYGGKITWQAYTTLKVPELTECFNSATGVRVSWLPTADTAKYQLLRKNLTLGETQWKLVGETTALTLIDTTAVSSCRYTYSVRPVSADGTVGACDGTGCTCTFIARADITNLRYGVKGVTLTWSKPAGAKNFRVMRCVDGTSTWTVLAVIEDTTYTDSTATIGTKYWYTVRGASMDNKTVINSYNETGWSLRPLSAPVLTEAFNSATGVRVSWKAVDGAAKYRLLRKDVNAGAGWEIIGETTACTLIDTTAKSASRYTYTVECVDSNGRTCSTSDSKGRTCTFIAMPKITALKSVSNGVALEWSKPAGAKNFRVFRKTENSGWQIMTDIQGTTYTDMTAQKGVKYWYTVRAITLAGDMYISSYNATGWSVTRK